jgi:hypothetical protein
LVGAPLVAPITPLRAVDRELLHSTEKVVGTGKSDTADWIQQLPLGKQNRGTDTVAYRRNGVDAIVEHRVAPGVGWQIGEIGKLLDAVPTDQRRQVHALRLQELRQAGDAKSVARAKAQQVRQGAAGDDRVELGWIVSQLRERQIDVEPGLLVDALPGGVLIGCCRRRLRRGR